MAKHSTVQIDLEIITLSKLSQRKTNSQDIACTWDLKKNGTDEFMYKAEIESQT